MEAVTVEKLVHGGQGLATNEDGQKLFLWNALPNEKVEYSIVKKKRDYKEAVATNILNPSSERIEPREPNIFLATSPWQMMTFEAENKYKALIASEAFARSGINLPDFEIQHDNNQYEYRNKMEYSFYGDDNGLHLALFNRGTHQKVIVYGSALALPAIDKAARDLCSFFESKGIQARQLKSLIVRCNQRGDTAAALFCKDEMMPDLAEALQYVGGLVVYYSNPRSPASVITSVLQELGQNLLHDDLQGKKLSYTAASFFQVNVPVFNTVLGRIKEFINGMPIVDMYAGVGSIGLAVSSSATLVELDEQNIKMAAMNAANKNRLVHASTEKSLEEISAGKLIIFDPPRSGLHAHVIERLLKVMPNRIIYLSCNVATHARDIALLYEGYELKFFEVYNFFPRTPHIETLAILDKR